VPDDLRTPQDMLASVDWDIPVTDAFVDGVRRGVRRRRILLGAAAGGTMLATATVATLVFSLAGTPAPAPEVSDVPAVPPAAASAHVADQRLDGFRIGHVPDGAVVAGMDSFYISAVSDKGLRNDGPPPSPGEPRASVTMRTFQRGIGGELYVTVLRPLPVARSTVPLAQVGDWLARWAASGIRPAETLRVPVGTARVFTVSGNEGTWHMLIVVTDDHAVITIGGSGSLTLAELKSVARGIT
jgi:hypothetical protein